MNVVQNDRLFRVWYIHKILFFQFLMCRTVSAISSAKAELRFAQLYPKRVETILDVVEIFEKQKS